MSEAVRLLNTSATAVSQSAGLAVADESVQVLSERDAQILEFERSWWAAENSKEQEVQARFGLSIGRYYQVLNQLIDQPAALQADPLLVKRLRRLRENRQKARSAKRLKLS